ncbi:hypothetical protein [Methylobacterium sp. ID0610]|uniref:hypothetical protein n=1 Tax=Methylobacterium carpenticola TaxID=3344827 RepID=UPI00368F04E4
MRTFAVEFHKTVSDGTGHDRRVLQWRCLIRAPSAGRAGTNAKAMLCARLGVADWQMRADSCAVRPVAERRIA